jgi:tripartite-type tricarboxylate transporter receptor subunit TctC
MLKTLRTAVLSLLPLALAAAGLAHAQAWPAKPVTLVIPFPAGGGADIVARSLAAKLSDRLKQPFVVENLPGAGGILGTQKVAAAPADGYTYVMGITNTFAINRTFYKQLNYDPVKDFQPVALLAVSPHILVINMETPAKNVQEYIEYVRKNKGKLAYASYGNGSTTHLISEMFKAQNGLDLVHIPYKGMPPALTDVMGDRISMLASSAAPAVPLVQGKKLRAIAIFGDKRIDSLPDVPTMTELGFKDSALTLWYAFFAPAGTPRPIVERMNAELRAIIAEKDTEEAFSKAGIFPQPMTVDEVTAFVRAESERWGKLVVLSGAKAD